RLMILMTIYRSSGYLRPDLKTVARETVFLLHRRAVNGKANRTAGFNLNTVLIHNMNAGLVGAPEYIANGNGTRSALANRLAVQGYFIPVVWLKSRRAAHLKAHVTTATVECLVVFRVGE